MLHRGQVHADGILARDSSEIIPHPRHFFSFKNSMVGKDFAAATCCLRFEGRDGIVLRQLLREGWYSYR